MTVKTSIAFALAAGAAILAAGAGAQAQSYGAAYDAPPPLYPYVVQHPYAAATDTYAIHRQATWHAHLRAHRYAHAAAHGRVAAHPTSAPGTTASDRPHRVVDRALIEELRRRMQPKVDQGNPDNAERTVIDTTKIVHDAPVVVETRRVVNDPPRVIVRRHLAESAPSRCRHSPIARCGIDLRARAEDDRGRVIHAEAEITILGPDRMSIRLFRKPRGAEARAQAGD